MEFGTAGTRQKMVGLRRAIAERMVESERGIRTTATSTSATFRPGTGANATQGIILRRRASSSRTCRSWSRRSLGAQGNPDRYSTYDEAAGEIVLHDQYNIGIAVATPAGLIVPVIRNADAIDLPTVTAEIERLSTAARSGQAKAADLRGGTFTVTSVGSIGGLISTPIINRPEVGIMAVGKVVRRPVYDLSGNIRPADLIYLSFSFDHRIVDGAVGAAFGNAVIRHLQHPATLLLPEKVRP